MKDLRPTCYFFTLSCEPASYFLFTSGTFIGPCMEAHPSSRQKSVCHCNIAMEGEIKRFAHVFTKNNFIYTSVEAHLYQCVCSG